jgi:hypothetical protein
MNGVWESGLQGFLNGRRHVGPRGSRPSSALEYHRGRQKISNGRDIRERRWSGESKHTGEHPRYEYDEPTWFHFRLLPSGSAKALPCRNSQIACELNDSQVCNW